MGTRNLLVIKIGGNYRVAQYGQWDGYPDGEGKYILNFLHQLTGERLEHFKNKCLALEWATDADIDQSLADFCGANGVESIPHERYGQWTDLHPEWSRDTGSKILNLVMNSSRSLRLTSHLSFVGDSLFCEWAYVIDFDSGTFEVYQGYNKKKLSSKERFYSFSPSVDDIKRFKHEKEEIYYPVRLKALFRLDDLPTEEDFLSISNAQLFKPYRAKPANRAKKGSRK